MSGINKVRIGGVNEHFNLPWIKLSENKNPSIGFQLEWKSFAGGTGVLTNALHQNEIDLAVLLTEGLVLDILKNKKLRLICFHVENPLRWAIHVRENEIITDDFFENKKFAVSRIGSGSHTMAKVLLNKRKLNYSEKNMLEVGSLEGGLKAVHENKADIFLWEKFTTQPFLSEYGLKSIGEVLTPWPPFSLASTQEYFEGNKNLIQEILREVRNQISAIKNDSYITGEFLKRWNISPENARNWLSEIKWNDQIPVSNEKLASVLENMCQSGLIDSVNIPESEIVAI